MHIETFIDEVMFKQPLRIAGRTLNSQSVLRVTVHGGPHVAHAEAAGVFYRGESGASMRREIDTLLPDLPADLLGVWGAVRQMAPGGARNALDWACWQLSAAARGEPTYRQAFLARVRPLVTMVTLGVAEPQQMAQAALALPSARALKLKLDGGDQDAARVIAVRKVRPDVRLSIDANEGWSLEHLDRMMAVLVDNGVELIEQPLPANADGALERMRAPIPLAADESLQTMADLDRVQARYQVTNIKLDKCGGLSEALALAAEARRRGLRVMIGCMGGRSMALLPAFIAAQGADLIDLDAPLFMASDTTPAALYHGGCISYAESAFSPSRSAAAAPYSASHAPVPHAVA
ncbi:enolase C-terminal domain-like protein [Rugamonas rivuli]|uniref:Dipeptide epimerase n=1 Tax=Rugamonas rivuli TaxID=2743358 RepID=A0A843SGF2_9BURK|nr:enolase C-terminal domain-like protein [Rugamonas rivuli]MQA22302.1 dipeptide epimerase [Rugamonas rivuli]